MAATWAIRLRLRFSPGLARRALASFNSQSDSRPIVPSLQLDLGGRLELHNVRGDGEQLSTVSLGVLLGVTYF
jgi:hypothetical protein